METIKMITLARLFVFIGMATSPIWGETDSKSLGNQRLEYWKKAASELPPLTSMRNEDKFEEIGKILRGLGDPKMYSERSEEAAALRQELQKEVINTPGHAIYFLNRIKNEQQAIRGLPKRPVPGRIEYDRNRYYIIYGVLPQMPSEETVRVLGELLWDDEDAHQAMPDDDWDQRQANSFLASQTLTGLSLRNPPIPSFQGSSQEINLWRSWYNEVKSGNRSFSFEGKNVEYRFSPNGEVTATPLKIETAPTSTSDTPYDRKTQLHREAFPSESSAQSSRWLWLLGGLAIVGFVFFLTLSRRQKIEHK